jgi:hypothetical protein
MWMQQQQQLPAAACLEPLQLLVHVRHNPQWCGACELCSSVCVDRQLRMLVSAVVSVGPDSELGLHRLRVQQHVSISETAELRLLVLVSEAMRRHRTAARPDNVQLRLHQFVSGRAAAVRQLQLRLRTKLSRSRSSRRRLFVQLQLAVRCVPRAQRQLHRLRV